MRLDPAGKSAMACTQIPDHLRVLDGRFDLAAVADNGRIVCQALYVGRDEIGHTVDVEILESDAQAVALLEHDQPRQPGLEDLERQPLEQQGFVIDREAVFAIVIGAVDGMARRHLAIPRHVSRRSREW